MTVLQFQLLYTLVTGQTARPEEVQLDDAKDGDYQHRQAMPEKTPRKKKRTR